MNKEQVVAYRDEAENKCRVLYDQLETAKAQIEQLSVELERARGDFRTYDKLVNEWDTSPQAAIPAHPLVPPEANRPPAEKEPIPKKEKSNV